MPRQIGLAVLRRPSPPPLSRVLLGEVVIAPKEAVKPIITKCSYQRHTVAERIQALTLLYCTDGDPSEDKYKKIKKIIGIGERSCRALAKRARERGFDPDSEDLRILEKYVVDGPRSGRPKTATTDEKQKEVIDLVKKDRSTRQYSSEYLAIQTGISRTSVIRIMKMNNMHKVKTTKKPGLTPSMREARLQFCLRYENWTLED
jgi:transposase